MSSMCERDALLGRTGTQERLIAPLVALIVLLFTIVGAIAAPSLGFLLQPSSKYLFLLFEAPGVVVNALKPYISNIGTTTASLVYCDAAGASQSRREDATGEHAMPASDKFAVLMENQVLTHVEAFLLHYPERREPFISRLKVLRSREVTCCPRFHEKLDDQADKLAKELLGKVRKCKPEAIIDAVDKAVRSAVILIQILYNLLSWMGGLVAVAVLLATFLCQMALVQLMGDQDAAIVAVTDRLTYVGTNKAKSKVLAEALNTQDKTTRTLAKWRNFRDSIYLGFFFTLFSCVDKDKAPILLAVYKYVTAIRDAFDKLCSWRVQLGPIVANCSLRTTQAALAVWWTLSNEAEKLEKAARILDNAI